MKLTMEDSALVLAALAVALEMRNDQHNREPGHTCVACTAWDKDGRNYNQLCDGCAERMAWIVAKAKGAGL